ncbi:PREDICTED: uncharacterized protein LOC105107761 [Populus euphratica]|uniref:Uncharacterized protein LOC105107761 n=1 Tax=Populus euphratica TaxID=75702 RepID=A0AAJ6WZE2_POPEU|nr:PREDICTED: uncharacterized protein LOC105107761 [Populus euphratica]
MTDEKPILALESSRSSASDSSSRSSELENDIPVSPFIQSKQADVGSAQGPIFPAVVESSQGPVFRAEVPSHIPVINTQVLPPTSPQLHVMGQPGGYDPNRIPSSIFAKPSNPAEWSVASNDSLFSIYMGNGSFSRDHAFMLYKSGELPRFDETGNASTSLSPVIEVENNDRKSEDISIDIKVKEEESTDSEEEPESTAEIRPTKEVLDATEKIICQEEMHLVEEIRVSFSSSNRSFQFPLLDATSGRSSFNEVMKKHSSEKHLEQETQPAETPGTTQKAEGHSPIKILVPFASSLYRGRPGQPRQTEDNGSRDNDSTFSAVFMKQSKRRRVGLTIFRFKRLIVVILDHVNWS